MTFTPHRGNKDSSSMRKVSKELTALDRYNNVTVAEPETRCQSRFGGRVKKMWTTNLTSSFSISSSST